MKNHIVSLLALTILTILGFGCATPTITQASNRGVIQGKGKGTKQVRHGVDFWENGNEPACKYQILGVVQMHLGDRLGPKSFLEIVGDGIQDGKYYPSIRKAVKKVGANAALQADTNFYGTSDYFVRENPNGSYRINQSIHASDTWLLIKYLND